MVWENMIMLKSKYGLVKPPRANNFLLQADTTEMALFSILISVPHFFQKALFHESVDAPRNALYLLGKTDLWGKAKVLARNSNLSSPLPEINTSLKHSLPEKIRG